MLTVLFTASIAAPAQLTLGSLSSSFATPVLTTLCALSPSFLTPSSCFWLFIHIANTTITNTNNTHHTIQQFIDDVEFYFPKGERSLVEYRSASRFGSNDGE